MKRKFYTFFNVDNKNNHEFITNAIGLKKYIYEMESHSDNLLKLAIIKNKKNDIIWKTRIVIWSKNFKININMKPRNVQYCFSKKIQIKLWPLYHCGYTTWAPKYNSLKSSNDRLKRYYRRHFFNSIYSSFQKQAMLSKKNKHIINEWRKKSNWRFSQNFIANKINKISKYKWKTPIWLARIPYRRGLETRSTRFISEFERRKIMLLSGKAERKSDKRGFFSHHRISGRIKFKRWRLTPWWLRRYVWHKKFTKAKLLTSARPKFRRNPAFKKISKFKKKYNKNIKEDSKEKRIIKSIKIENKKFPYEKKNDWWFKYKHFKLDNNTFSVLKKKKNSPIRMKSKWIKLIRVMPRGLDDDKLRNAFLSTERWKEYLYNKKKKKK